MKVKMMVSLTSKPVSDSLVWRLRCHLRGMLLRYQGRPSYRGMPMFFVLLYYCISVHTDSIRRIEASGAGGMEVTSPDGELQPELVETFKREVSQTRHA